MVDLKKIKPLGVVLILLFAVLVVVLCFTADMGVPKPYAPEHDAAWYAESDEHMAALVAELEREEFPRLEGITRYACAPGERKVTVTVDRKNFGKVSAVLERDFGTELFVFLHSEDAPASSHD